MSDDKVFVEGMMVKLPEAGAPDFLKLKLSIKLDEFGKWIADQKRNDSEIEWINLEVKEGRSGKWYLERNMWKPTAQKAPPVKEDIPW